MAALFYSDPIWIKCILYVCILYVLYKKSEVLNLFEISCRITKIGREFVWQLYDITVRSGLFQFIYSVQ